MSKYLKRVLKRRKLKNILCLDERVEASVKALNERLRRHLREYGKENSQGYQNYLRDVNEGASRKIIQKPLDTGYENE